MDTGSALMLPTAGASSSWEAPEPPHSLMALADAATVCPLDCSHLGDSGEIAIPVGEIVSQAQHLRGFQDSKQAFEGTAEGRGRGDYRVPAGRQGLRPGRT